MPAEWTAEIIGQMHLHGITAKSLAEEIGCTPEYISTILNGHREPKGAEAKFRSALESLIKQKAEDI